MNNKKKVIIVSLVGLLSVLVIAAGAFLIAKTFIKKDKGNEFSIKKDYKLDKVVKPGEYKGIEVVTTPTEEEIQSEIQNTLNTNIEQIKEGKAKDGDTVNIKYAGTIDGVAFEGGTSESTNLILGSGQFIPGFEEKVVGHEVGKEFAIDVTFPDDYQDEKVKGKDAVFTITINYINGAVPEFNDAFVQKLSGDYKTAEEYEEFIKSDLKNTKKEEIPNMAFTKVVENAEIIEYPENLLESMKARFDAQYRMYAEQYQMEFDEFLTQMGMDEAAFNEQVVEASKYYIDQLLVAEAIAKAEKITISDEEYEKQVTTFMENHQKESEKDLETYFLETFKADLRDIINETLLIEKAASFVGSQAVEK